MKHCTIFTLLVIIFMGNMMSGYPNDSRIPKQVTIWVHGTRGAAFFPPSITQEINRIEHDVCTVPNGLNRAEDIDPRYYQRTIGQILGEYAPEEFPFENFYVYGWSGQLSLERRLQEGKGFYHAVEKLVTDYRKEGYEPKITIFTHSHGGNLTLGAVQNFDPNQSHFTIHRLVLLACPVQQATSSFIHSTLFDEVFVLFSPIDLIQMLDPQRLHLLHIEIKESWAKRCWRSLAQAWKKVSTIPLFSSRTFVSNPQTKSRIKQVGLFWQDKAPWTIRDVALFGSYASWVKKLVDIFDVAPGRGLAHLEFMLPLFLQRLPSLLHEIEQLSYTETPQYLSL